MAILLRASSSHIPVVTLLVVLFLVVRSPVVFTVGILTELLLDQQACSVALCCETTRVESRIRAI